MIAGHSLQAWQRAFPRRTAGLRAAHSGDTGAFNGDPDPATTFMNFGGGLLVGLGVGTLVLGPLFQDWAEKQR